MVDPRRGGKITSLQDRSGSEWLAQTDPAREVTAEARFVDAEMAGWDECAPTIAACTVRGRELPDHGDLWNRPMTPDGQELHAHGETFEYRFSRSMSESPGGGIRLTYECSTPLRNLPFLWAAHPQFLAETGSSVQIDERASRALDVEHPEVGYVPWSEELATIDSLERGSTRKLWVHPDEAPTWAKLVSPRRGTLALSWSEGCRYLAVWFDHAAVNTQPVIAIEPALAFSDSLATAIELGRAAHLEPGKPLRWWVDIDLAD
ncbi:hypothetical protein EV279_1052 [Microbacterium sp. BK668]|nr:hypothetical protein EV279_1052 [Microbacterium sp. BK668]